MQAVLIPNQEKAETVLVALYNHVSNNNAESMVGVMGAEALHLFARHLSVILSANTNVRSGVQYAEDALRAIFQKQGRVFEEEIDLVLRNIADGAQKKKIFDEACTMLGFNSRSLNAA